MLFRQLFEPKSSAYTYLIACEEAREAVLIDPVFETVERDLKLLDELGLTLKYTIETHIHADHVTGAAKLREATGCKCAVPAKSGADQVDVAVREGVPIEFGFGCSRSIRRATPTIIIAICSRPTALAASSPATP
jgi:sulfur dioxygenase